MRYLYDEVRTLEEVEALVEKRTTMTSLNENDDPLVLAAERTDDGRVIGDVSLSAAQRLPPAGRDRLRVPPRRPGSWVRPRGCDGDVAGGLRRGRPAPRYGRTDARNEASAGLMRRLGMRQEAHLRDNEIFKGEWSDELVFAILEDEWKARD